MKVAIVSDIHGNMKALDIFLKYLKGKDINKVLNMGDIMGGIDPKAILKVIKKDKRFINVAGNHDDTLTYIEEELSEEEIRWLKDIPIIRIVNIEGKKFLMVHSRITNNRDIPLLYNEGLLLDFLNDYKGEWDYVLFGHTHYQCLLSFYEGKTMINPGSLGLSYDNKVSFAIIDVNDDDISIKFEKLSY